jgi:hypothetical protein
LPDNVWVWCLPSGGQVTVGHFIGASGVSAFEQMLRRHVFLSLDVQLVQKNIKMLIKGIVRKNLTLRVHNIPENINMFFKYTFLAKIVELVFPTIPKLVFLSKEFDILDIRLLLGQHFIIPNHSLP